MCNGGKNQTAKIVLINSLFKNYQNNLKRSVDEWSRHEKNFNMNITNTHEVGNSRRSCDHKESIKLQFYVA